MKKILDVEKLGQVFTPKETVSFMLSLRKNYGSILEPSCGNGAFFNKIQDCVGIELDDNVCPEGAINMDFFDYPTENKFDTIIGNPPYVKFKNIQESTLNKLDMELFDKRSNLYLFFIEKCVKHLNSHGELIFIVPREFLKATSARKLNNFLFNSGTITDFVDLGDTKIFSNADPNCVIFRFEKDNFSRTLSNDLIFSVEEGQIYFRKQEATNLFSELFFVKVGAVSGADKYFESPFGNKEFVYSQTCKTGSLKRMIYNEESEHLVPYKEKLISRKIKKFNESNWYEWGRNLYESDALRIYVNSKTRNRKPFFYNDCLNYDGSILAIFPKKEITKEKCLKIIEIFNNEIDWKSLGFVCGGRFLFSQRALENCSLPQGVFNSIKSIIEEEEI